MRRRRADHHRRLRAEPHRLAAAVPAHQLRSGSPVTTAARGGQRGGLHGSRAGARSEAGSATNGIDPHIIGAAFAAELDAKRAVKQDTELAARLSSRAISAEREPRCQAAELQIVTSGAWCPIVVAMEECPRGLVALAKDGNRWADVVAVYSTVY